MPDFTIAALLESAVKAAVQLESKSNSNDEYLLIDSFELPEASMVALHDVVERTSTHRFNQGHRTTRNASNAKGVCRQIVSLPSANLCLDLEIGKVSIRWAGKQYPDSFLGDRIDFYIDGEKQHEQQFESRLNKCILDDVEIKIPPQPRYDIELRLMKKTDNGEYELASAHEQSFERSKPGCFEFIRTIDGTFRLRNRNDRINKSRQVAYVIKKGYHIQPGSGMTPIAVYESGESWNGSSAFVFMVEPGAGGSIFKEKDNGQDEEVAIWQESYHAHIDKEHIIGKTLEGLDLFGYVYCENGDNNGLPRITIETADSQTAFDDLDVTCVSDGKIVHVPKEIVWEEKSEDYESSKIALALERTEISRLSESVEITARQISKRGRVVFKYRFAIAPIENFKLEEAYIDNGFAIARYSFDSKLDIKITDFNSTTEEVLKQGHYSKKCF